MTTERMPTVHQRGRRRAVTREHHVRRHGDADRAVRPAVFVVQRVTSSPDIVVKAPAAMIALAAATNAHHARCTRGGGAAVRRLRLMRQACAAGSRATSGSKDNMRKKRAKSSRAPVLLAARAPGPGGCFPVVFPEFRGTSAPPHRGVVY